MIYIILYEPEIPGNIGAIARAMANFDFENLVIINPQCEVRSSDAYRRAKHADFILNNAKIKDKSFLEEMDYIVGTTARIGTDANLNRSPITPEEMSKIISDKVNSNVKIGLMFGRESHGLSNEELKLCDTVVTIPCSKKYFTMNLSHAVTILLYEIFKRIGKGHNEGITYASKKEINALERHFDEMLNLLDFEDENKRETQRFNFSRMIGRLYVKKKEVFIIHGLLTKIINKIKKDK